MTLHDTTWGRRFEPELVATFGDAQLVEHRDGRFELQGGTRADQAEAREWCALFLHEAVLDPAPVPYRSAPSLAR